MPLLQGLGLEQGQAGGRLLEVQVQARLQAQVQVQGLLQVLQGHEPGQVILSWASFDFSWGVLVSDFEDRSCWTDCLDWPSAVSNMAAALFCNPPSRAFWATACERHQL